MTEHDKKVQRIAAAYVGMGYDVRADLPWYERPKPIGGRVPDVAARRMKTTRMI